MATAAVDPADVTITPRPTADELTAILKAYTELWPSEAATVDPNEGIQWRFSGRWWNRHR